MHTAHSTQHTAHSTQHTAHSTQHTAHSTQHTAHSTQHTAHSTQPDYSHLGLFVKDFARDSSAFLGGRVPFCVSIHDLSDVYYGGCLWY